jgi:hypothetical protein
MKRLPVLVAGLVAPVAFAAATAGAVAPASSGDTCKASGSGTTYTLHITVPAGSRQYGFAFGAPGAKVTSAVIPGMNGSFSRENLAANTTGAWISDAPVTGSAVASLTLSGQMSGALRIVPASDASPTYLSPVICPLARSAPATGSAVFSVAHAASYNPAARIWQLVVAIGGPGTVSAKEPEPTISTAAPGGTTAKPFVQVRRVALKTPGKVTLALRPTAVGQAKLAAKGSMSVRLLVTFDAGSGKSATKTVRLTLRK